MSKLLSSLDPEPIITVRGHRLYELVRSALFCVHKVDVIVYHVGAQDTVITYQVMAKGKVTKGRLRELQAFAAGVAECYRLQT